MLIDDVQVFEIFFDFRVWVNVNVADINVNFIDWDVVITSKIQFCLHSFHNYFVHSLIFWMELVFLIVQSVQKILYVWNFRKIWRKKVKQCKIKNVITSCNILLRIVNFFLDIFKDAVFLSLFKIKNKFTDFIIFKF